MARAEKRDERETDEERRVEAEQRKLDAMARERYREQHDLASRCLIGEAAAQLRRRFRPSDKGATIMHPPAKTLEVHMKEARKSTLLRKMQRRSEADHLTWRRNIQRPPLRVPSSGRSEFSKLFGGHPSDDKVARSNEKKRKQKDQMSC